MRAEEVKMLLALASAIDGRIVSDMAVTAWLDVPGIDRLSAEDARRALALHRAEHPGKWFEPGHALAGARRVRDEREVNERRMRAIEPVVDDPCATCGHAARDHALRDGAKRQVCRDCLCIDYVRVRSTG